MKYILFSLGSMRGLPRLARDTMLHLTSIKDKQDPFLAFLSAYIRSSMYSTHTAYVYPHCLAIDAKQCFAAAVGAPPTVS